LNPVDPAETLARFLYSKNHYKPSDHTVRYAAFMPPTSKRLSVFRIFTLQENEIWKLGDTLRIEPPLGRADIKALVVTETGLTVEADDIPPRHANIIGWPNESSEIKLKALILAEKALLRMK
jgi:hypothetical protein